MNIFEDLFYILLIIFSFYKLFFRPSFNPEINHPAYF